MAFSCVDKGKIFQLHYLIAVRQHFTMINMTGIINTTPENRPLKHILFCTMKEIDCTQFLPAGPFFLDPLKVRLVSKSTLLATVLKEINGDSKSSQTKLEGARESAYLRQVNF